MPKKESKKVVETKPTKNEKKQNNVKVKKEKKNSFKNMKSELKKVTWPTPKDLVKKTMAVIVIVLIVSAIVFLFDVIFENLYNLGTGALETVLTGDEKVSDTTAGDTANITVGDTADTTGDHEEHNH